ncbi:glycosyltransferase family 39 protein [Mycobacterium sp. MYCO198283]|uniref:glycosyltransferase family 39 protein n=1 Tax=Mycobacterium sp. MYCO198283 TaxID=2883505 RepID=UPI001E4880A8|nr:glycosyltransferase family 39 protein [Mycobacterium sp. MYCO198283]MCG5433458.1 glycosyltransferase family 39 protein [Mycobacterium sp. MYCO198283]
MPDAAVLTRDAVPVEAKAPQRRRPGRWDAAWIAVLAGVVGAAGASRPSLWFDEAATVSAAQRPLDELARLLGNIDAVHGLYYLVMHGWLNVFPPTEFWLRLPSCLAVAGAAAGVVLLARQLSTRAVAVCAGVVFALLPRVTWAAIEARPYAMAMLLAVWLTVFVVAALRRNRWWLWLLYPLLLASAVLMNMFVALTVIAFPVLAAVVGARRWARCWLVVTTVAAAGALVPFALFARTQIRQVGWITPPGGKTVGEVAVEQYFDNSLPFAVTAGALLVGAALCWRLVPRPPGDRPAGLAVFAIAWAAAPTLVMVVYSVVGDPVYYPRYLTFTAPAMALLLGVCLATVAPARGPVLALIAALALAAAPNFVVVQRGPYAKEEMDFSAVADVIDAGAAPGDCLLLDNTTDWLPGPIRPLTAARPDTYRTLVDPARGRTARARNMLWDSHIPVWNVTRRIAGCPTVWLVSERDLTQPDHAAGASLPAGPRLAKAPAYGVAQQLGFRIVERWQFSFAQVVKAVPSGGR